MRVVHVGFHLDRRSRDPEALLAAWPTLPGVARAVAAAGVEVVVVQPAHRDASFRHDGVEYRFVAERPARLRAGTAGTRPVRSPGRRVIDLIARARPDVVHVNGLSVPHHADRLKRRLPRVPILAQDHGDPVPRPWRRPAARRAMSAFDAVAFTARDQARPFVRAGVLPPRLRVFEVLEASSDFGPGDPRAARRREGIHGDPCLAWVGRLDEVKDPLTVLEAFAAAAPLLRDPHLWVCHQAASLHDAVRRTIAADPVLSSRVHLLGPRPHDAVERLLQAADALVLGSRREGSGYAVIEAMACGATPVVTDIPSFRRIVGDAGLLWPVGDAAAAAAAMARLADVDPQARRARVRERFERSLAWDVVGRDLVACYRALAPRADREAVTA